MDPFRILLRRSLIREDVRPGGAILFLLSCSSGRPTLVFVKNIRYNVVG